MKSLALILRDVDGGGPYPADPPPGPPPHVDRAVLEIAYRQLHAWLPVTDDQWPRPPVGPWDGRQRVAERDLAIGRLTWTYLQDWWTDNAQLARYADVDRYELDDAHNALVYWPPMRVLQRTQTRGALHLRIAADGEQGREEIRYALRLAAIHGLASVALEGPPTLIAGVWGWLDVRFNHNSGARAARPFTAFATPPAGPTPLTWSPPAVRLWARMNEAEREGAGRSVLRFASAVQDWAATVGKKAHRFIWSEEEATVNAGLLFLAPLDRAPQWERIHGLPPAAVQALTEARVAGLYCLHVRRLKLYNADDEGRLLALLNAFFVELARMLDLHLSVDAGYTADGDEDKLLYLGHLPVGEFVYPTWQLGCGPWPYFYRLPTPAAYDTAREIFFAPAAPHAQDHTGLRYMDREAWARLSDLEARAEVEEEDVREKFVREHKQKRTEPPTVPKERPTKRARTQARCFTCQRLHARTATLALAPVRLCSDECYRLYSLLGRNRSLE
jgi:hypothetical protein